MQLQAHGLTDIGLKRSGNEDAFLLTALASPTPDPLPPSSAFSAPLPPEGAFLAVSDGIGGCNAGEVASALSLTTLHELLRRQPTPNNPAALFFQALHDTDVAVRQAASLSPARHGMGATLTALWLRHDGAWLGQVGDSRLYRWRAGSLLQLSPEHSPVGRMRLRGELTEEEARQHRFKNVIDQSLGGDPDIFAPEVIPLDLHSGDVVLLCSDGLTDGLPDADLHPVLDLIAQGTLPLENAASSLIASGNLASGRDNITVLLARLT